MTDIEYATDKVIETLESIAIDDMLRLKLEWYILKSFESEKTLEDNCMILDNHNRKEEGKSLCLRKNQK